MGTCRHRQGFAVGTSSALTVRGRVDDQKPLFFQRRHASRHLGQLRSGARGQSQWPRRGQGSAPGTPAREGAVCRAPCGLQEEQALFVYPLGASRGPPVPSRHHLRGREARRQEATSEGGDILARQSRCPCQSSDLQATALPCNRLWPLYQPGEEVHG